MLKGTSRAQLLNPFPSHLFGMTIKPLRPPPAYPPQPKTSHNCWSISVQQKHCYLPLRFSQTPSNSTLNHCLHGDRQPRHANLTHVNCLRNAPTFFPQIEVLIIPPLPETRKLWLQQKKQLKNPIAEYHRQKTRMTLMPMITVDKRETLRRGYTC